MFQVTHDGSVLHRDGRVLFFSVQRFISDIANGDCCFLCGAQRDSALFNDEHVVPDWILRRFELHERHIEIPNRTLFRYGSMSIPCCAACNARMGEELEKPMATLFAGGYEAVSQELKSHGPWRLFCWMALVFLKTHLKDKYLNYHRDHRKGDMKIAELHSWEDLHHLHCVVRSFYSGTRLAQEVLGSLVVLPAKVRPHFEGFDFVDLSAAQTMLLCIDDVAVIAVFNDSQAAMSVAFEDLARKIDGPLSPLQLRELMATLAYINLQVEPRTRFFSDIDILREEYCIKAERPDEVQVSAWNHEVYGQLMCKLSEDMIKGLHNADEVFQFVKTGRYTFLTTPAGTFDYQSMEFAPDPANEAVNDPTLSE